VRVTFADPQLTLAVAISAAINARTVVAAYSYSVIVMADSCRWIVSVD
jgi:hypothetical protein